MRSTFRQSMAWLHTWGGLWVTWVLFAIFLTGTLGVFDDAISHWMRDKGRAEATPALDAAGRAGALQAAQAFLMREAPQAEFWSIGLPGEEDPALQLAWQRDEDGPIESRRLDPVSGALLPRSQQRETEGGHHFVHMHFELHAGTVGIWLVGIATLAMLVALVSGIVVHKKIFTDFFTFRPGKGQRSWLDGHNALGVLTLPFLFMITYTGLVIFWATYMPAGILARYDGDREAFFSALTEGPAPRPEQHVAAPVLPMRPLLPVAEQALAREAAFVVVNHPGDRSASLRVFGRFDPDADSDRLVGRSSGRVQFDAVTGELLDVQRPNTTRGGEVLAVQRTMNALHFVRFGGWPLKWLYFVSGMAGAAMLATGAILFVVKRRRRGDDAFGAATPRVMRIIEALNVAGIAGLGLSCVAYLWINRLLPLGIESRAAWEIRLFFGAWLLSLLHAGLRPPLRAWSEQLLAAALLCLGLPLVNAFSTGDHLLAALQRGDGESAGVELTVLAFGALFALGWRRLRARLQGDGSSPLAAGPVAEGH